jgi:SAM-dependent methyltransferase
MPAAATDTNSNRNIQVAWQRLRRSGLRRSLQRWVHRLLWSAVERLYGIDTSGSIAGKELGHGANQFGYQPIDCQSFVLALRRAGVRRQDVFIDFGCGKGRALLLAALFPFRRIIGVERSSELCDHARRNTAAAPRWLRCRQIEVVRTDAVDYFVPDDATLLFLYNPFTSDVLESVLEHIRQSLLRRPRNLRIVYALPKMDRDRLAEIPWLEVDQLLQSASCDWQRLTIYRADLRQFPACPEAADADVEVEGLFAGGRT